MRPLCSPSLAVTSVEQDSKVNEAAHVKQPALPEHGTRYGRCCHGLMRGRAHRALCRRMPCTLDSCGHNLAVCGSNMASSGGLEIEDQLPTFKYAGLGT